MILADHGADVVRVDPPAGPRWRTDAHAVLQRGKRSIALDLNRADDLAIARRLVEHADVVIEGFHPGVMARLGLTPVDRNVWCSIPGFASDDPQRGLSPRGKGSSAQPPVTTRAALGREVTGPAFLSVPLGLLFASLVP